jgi:hypothetical protein
MSIQNKLGNEMEISILLKKSVGQFTLERVVLNEVFWDI